MKSVILNIYLSTQRRPGYSYVDVIDINGFRSLSGTGWSLWNINFSNGNGSFDFNRDYFLSSITENTLFDFTIWVTQWVSYNKQELLILREHVSLPPVCLFSFCVLCPILPVSLDCPFLIIPSWCFFLMLIILVNLLDYISGLVILKFWL